MRSAFCALLVFSPYFIFFLPKKKTYFMYVTHIHHIFQGFAVLLNLCPSLHILTAYFLRSIWAVLYYFGVLHSFLGHFMPFWVILGFYVPQTPCTCFGLCMPMAMCFGKKFYCTSFWEMTQNGPKWPEMNLSTPDVYRSLSKQVFASLKKFFL